MTRRHTSTHALGELAGSWCSDLTRTQLRMVLAFVLVCLAVTLLALLLHVSQPTVAAWRAAAEGAQRAHLQQLLQDAQDRSERAYVASVQAQCGAEAWFKPREGATPVCTDKHGRRTGQPFTGAQP